jgi:tRNA/tmRNA/rRNA uracil-C5-methylase (TrmA/RlmC/RlmD family)
VASSLTVFGRETVEEAVGPISLDMAAASFSQLNSEMTARIYEEAAKSVDQANVVWDLYCGLGGLGLTVAHKERETALYGADVAAASIELARAAASREGVQAYFEVVDLRERFTLQWPNPEVIIVNPPRRGLDEAVLALLEESQARKLVYMSCNPNSFARDARMLVDSQFRFPKCDAYDMLPKTTHVELLGIFEKGDLKN